ncbi:MAG: tetratricopeptide repeat protein [bacterium]|nr:tetratricopeptide repeat protein [bacterium]
MYGEKKMQPSPGLVMYWSKLGDQWTKMGRIKEANQYYQKAYEMSERVYGPRHQTTQTLSTRLEMPA